MIGVSVLLVSVPRGSRNFSILSLSSLFSSSVCLVELWCQMSTSQTLASSEACENGGRQAWHGMECSLSGLIHPLSPLLLTHALLSRLRHHSGAPSYFSGPLRYEAQRAPDGQGGKRGSVSLDDFNGICL